MNRARAPPRELHLLFATIAAAAVAWRRPASPTLCQARFCAAMSLLEPFLLESVSLVFFYGGCALLVISLTSFERKSSLFTAWFWWIVMSDSVLCCGLWIKISLSMLVVLLWIKLINISYLGLARPIFPVYRHGEDRKFVPLSVLFWPFAMELIWDGVSFILTVNCRVVIEI